MTNHLKEVLAKEGRSSWGDNRSVAVRNINRSIELGIKLHICEKNKYWVAKDGVEYNVCIIYKTFRTRYMVKERQINDYYILTLLGRFFKKPRVKELITINIITPTDCSKCSGSGILPHFMYYAEGVCFDCGGSGLTFNK